MYKVTNLQIETLDKQTNLHIFTKTTIISLYQHSNQTGFTKFYPAVKKWYDLYHILSEVDIHVCQ
jgi:hypothetical protein